MMEYSGLDVLLPLIRPDVPQCPDVTIEQYLVRAARKFCEDSRVWQQWASELVDPDIETYPISLDHGEIVSINKVQTDTGVPLTALGYTIPGQEEDNMRALSGVQGYTFDPPDTLHLQGTPTQQMELFVRLSLKPTLADAEAPSWLVERYEEAIISGALYRLMMITGKTWSNPDFAAVHKDNFVRGISAARIDEIKKHTNASLTINARPFGGW